MDIIQVLQDYLVLVVVGLCYCIGFAIKKFDKISNKWIPPIVMILGGFFNIWVNGWSITPEILLGGFASGLAATGFDQLVRTKEYDSNK